MEKRKSAPGLVLFIILLLVSTVVMTFLGDGALGIPGTIIRYVIGIIGVVSMIKLYGTEFKFKGFSKGLFSVAGLLGIASCIRSFIGGMAPTDIGFMEGLPSAIFMLIFMFSVGLYEETLFRGVLFNTLRNRFGESKRGIILAVVMSAIPFALIHFTNLMMYPNLVVTTTFQVVYVFFAGIFLASIYYITNNFWVVVFIHGVYDFVESVWACYSSQLDGIGMPTMDKTILEGIMSAIPDTIFGVIALILLIAVLNKRENERRSIDREYYA